MARRTAWWLVVYGLLLGGSLVFVLPFVWMLGTSFKVEREMFTEKIRLFPSAPVPAQRSPYLDRNYFPDPDDARFDALRGEILASLRGRDLAIPGCASGGEDAPEILARGIFAHLARQLPDRVWDSGGTELREAVSNGITDEVVAETSRKVVRRLTLGAVRVRSLDLQEVELTAGQPVSAFWQVSGTAAARLADCEERGVRMADIVYDMSAEGRQEIHLQGRAELPFPPERIHRVQIAMRPDDGWHRVDVELAMNGRRYRAVYPEFTGNFQWMVVTLQEYGPDDEPDSNKIRSWNPYREVGRDGEVGGNGLRISVVVTENSKVGAWRAKCQRNYRGALNYIPFGRYFGVSLFLVVLNIVGTIFACSLVAYSFARLQWPGRAAAFGVMLATMMIPHQVTMIPYFLIVKNLGWYNTLKPLWLMSLFGNAFNIFLLRQFMKGIPRDLEDAARIDGCNAFQIYWYVMLPLVKPTLACIGIFTFMGVWNDFMGPLIYLSDQRLYPLSLGLYALNVQASGNHGMMMAASFLMTLPVVIVFFFAQKYFIQGITLTGMKS
jgi:ABC-type glycerol-3-phosphate transport system permease component